MKNSKLFFLAESLKKKNNNINKNKQEKLWEKKKIPNKQINLEFLYFYSFLHWRINKLLLFLKYSSLLLLFFTILSLLALSVFIIIITIFIKISSNIIVSRCFSPWFLMDFISFLLSFHFLVSFIFSFSFYNAFLFFHLILTFLMYNLLNIFHLLT